MNNLHFKPFPSPFIAVSLAIGLACGLFGATRPSTSCFAQDGNDLTPPRVPLAPTPAAASGEAELAIKQFKLSPDLQCSLFVAEPNVANIVAFYRDYQGKMFVCETFRQPKNSGVEDNRDHPYWLVDDLKAQTVADRVDFIRKHIPDADNLYTQHDDRIRLVTDRSGDGVADHSQVFADRFNQIAMGTGADILPYKGSVYFTCIPDLFKLTDTTGDGVADQRESLHTGYGVRFAFRGHDLHGLVIGPDRRLYFSIGDRGYNVSPEIFDPASGAVFRCELDGSDLEVVNTGLRNPQNLAFDNYGNLFSCDNNSDSGDQCRWTYLVPGGDSGWRMHYQYLPDRGPFNREKIWHAFHEHSPAYIVPPIANISDGPSGLDFYPGTGFGETFADSFLLCDFRGTSFNSGVRSIRNRQVGAFWEIAQSDQPIWGILTTDLQFASDGRLYVSDWVNGWYGENTGRIYAFTDPQHAQSDIVVEVERLLREGMEDRSTAELVTLLEHVDRRVRQESQFELVDRDCQEELKSVASNHPSSMARLHALWGLEILTRQQQRGQTTNVNLNRSAAAASVATDAIDSLAWEDFLTPLLADENVEIRAHSTLLASNLGTTFKAQLLPMLQDDNLRVRYYAAMALTKMPDSDCLVPVTEMLADNNNADPIIRQGGVMLLKSILHRQLLNDGLGSQQPNGGNGGNGDLATSIEPAAVTLSMLVNHTFPTVRMATVVAIRKLLEQPGLDRDRMVSLFSSEIDALLQDDDGRVCLETARMIYDLPVNSWMSKLAETELYTATGKERIEPSFLQEALIRRVVQANLRSGTDGDARRLAVFACDHRMDAARRTDALAALINWTTDFEIDSLNHDYRPLDTRDRNQEIARVVVAEAFANLLAGPPELTAVAIEGAGKLELKKLAPTLVDLVLSVEVAEDHRAKAMASLTRMDAAELEPLIMQLREQFAQSPDSFPVDLLIELGSASNRISTRSGSSLSEQAGLEILTYIADNEQIPIANRQQSVRTLGRFDGELSRNWLLQKLEQVSDGRIRPELRLDYLSAAQSRPEPQLQQAANQYFANLKSPDDPSALFVDSLVGGDYRRGRLIFENKTEVSCIRCHRVASTETAVGPYLGEIGLKRDRQHLLDSIVQPNKDISEGFGQIKVQTIDGLMFTGLLVEENAAELKLLDADGNTNAISRDDIEEVKPGLSSMPLDLIHNLTHDELRDLVEYLAGQRGTGSEPANESEHR